MKQQALQHLLSRAAFGASAQHLQEYLHLDRSEVIDDLFLKSDSYPLFDVDLSSFLNEANQLSLRNKKDLAALIKKSRSKFLELNNVWLNGVMNNSCELRERMLLFWTNHFVCKDKNVYHMQMYLNCLRKHALGDFREFVKAVSKQASMLKYLNGKQNRKRSPNENFARELMELFTLGEGHYSERDIRESARAFTGYNHNFKGEYILRRFQQDQSKKTFLGKTGYFNGDDIIDRILEQPQCARFICEKLYRHFVNPIPNEDHVTELSHRFRKDYHIGNLMRYMFNQDWFYNDNNMGVKLKSPVDLMASAYRIWPYEFKDDKSFLRVQKLLGQVLLDPPNVAGWAEDRAWIDTNTLMMRLKLPSLIYNIDLSTGENIRGSRAKKTRPLVAESDVQVLDNIYKDFDEDKLRAIVFAYPIEHNNSWYSASKKPLYVVRLMSLPEFQLS